MFGQKIAANMMNEYFTDVGPSLAKSFNNNWRFFFEKKHPGELQDFVVEREEVLKLCKEINVNKSSAIDHVSSKIFKLACITLIDHFTYILNLSLTTATVADKWKLATITPLFKSGDATQCNYYRPISILPLHGKLIERIVHHRLYNFLENNHIQKPRWL